MDCSQLVSAWEGDCWIPRRCLGHKFSQQFPSIKWLEMGWEARSRTSRLGCCDCGWSTGWNQSPSRKKQLGDVDAASDTYMGKRGALPPANPPQPVLNLSWGLFLTVQTPPCPRHCFLRKEDTSSGIWQCLQGDTFSYVHRIRSTTPPTTKCMCYQSLGKGSSREDRERKAALGIGAKPFPCKCGESLQPVQQNKRFCEPA